nr:13255_t:CDS:1 [Entrophospora candida]CAG8467936.1 3367_t:CDS:1 [Entrophospora candida]
MSLEKIYNIFSKEECNSFNYTWVIENFQNFYIYKKVLKIKSDEFTEPKLNNNFLFEEEDLFTPLFITKADKLDYIWQIHLYLNIDVEEKDFISLYLFPIKNNSNRYVKWKFELYKYTSNDDNDEFLEENEKNEEENFELLSRNYEYEHDIFDDDEGWGYEKFCEIKKIFPNFEDYKKTNLVIHLHIQTQCYCILPYEIFLNSTKNFENSTFESYFDNENFSDVTFVFPCGNQLKASRKVLSTKSTYFEKMFTGEWMERYESIIKIKETKFETFRSIIYFLYTGKIELDQSFQDLKDLYIEADIRGIEEVVKLITISFSYKLNKDNWYEIFLLGDDTNNISLKNIVFQYMFDNWLEIEKNQETDYLLSYDDGKLIDQLKRVDNSNTIISNTWNLV